MKTINGVHLPDGYNGICLHDTPGAGTADMDEHQAREHARTLLAHGVTGYKLFTEGMKLKRAQAYRDAGILTIVRFWEGNQHWGTPPGLWVTEDNKIRPFVEEAGVQLFELGGNEFNIAEEWKDKHVPFDTGIIARVVLDAWEVMLNRGGEVPGCIPLFPSNTPGGNVDHRRCYRAIAEEIDKRGLAHTIQHVAIHPRPHNNPPDSVWTATNTVTYDEWRWIRDTLKAVGVNAYYWATEHGYSLHDDQNREHPQIDLNMWTEYNWQLWQRLNPNHPTPTEPELAGTFYWFEAGWWHWGAWGKDALRDSNVPEMPAPSPLWDRMGREAVSLRFERYPAAPPPPPVPKPERYHDMTKRLARLPGARPYPVRKKPPTRLIIHHSGYQADPDVSGYDEAKKMAKYHINRWGWPNIGYSFVIGYHGAIWQTANLGSVTNHTGGYNSTSVGICIVGNFNANRDGRPTNAQLRSASGLVAWLKTQLPITEVCGHRDKHATACPGNTWDDWQGEVLEG